ncbi:MAG: UpxY family transcription antiterminator, partial [Prevotellaceae bacterium]|nr:UpxY family transcription antiterminator [Candidatus Colivivens equi]
REKKAYEYFLQKGIKSFYPTITKKIEGEDKTRYVEESRIPNIFFAYDSFDTLKQYVYDNVHDETKHIRFYYNRHHDGTKEPLIIPDWQINSLMLICESEEDDIILEPITAEKFIKGQHVLVKEGPFAGVQGIVARFMGQQRVGISIDGLFTMTTAYVPSAFLERLDTANTPR